MPPKAKFTKEQITKAALGVVSEKGVQALTAKELGAALGTSTTPIFTVFNSMQEVQDAVMLAAMERFEEYAHKAAHLGPVFKQVGMQMILFAKEEPSCTNSFLCLPSAKHRPLMIFTLTWVLLPMNVWMYFKKTTI